MSSISSSSSVEPPETESVSGKGGAHDDALVEEDLFELARSLCGSIQPEDGGPDASGLPTLRLNYDVYCIVRSDLRPRLQRLLSATTFLKFPRDAQDRINARSLFRYVRGRLQLSRLRQKLSLFDSAGDGFLREHDLENFVFDSIPEIPDLAELQENFFPFYVFTAVRKFFFFLDIRRTGRISINDVVSSRVAAEWLHLSPPAPPIQFSDFIGHRRSAAESQEGLRSSNADAASVSEGEVDPPSSPASVEPSASRHSSLTGGAQDAASTASDPLGGAIRALLDSVYTSPTAAAASAANGGNWFSAANALRVYSLYLELDSDQNGMLSAAELMQFRGGNLTESFVRRVYEECHTYGGEMDYKAFLDFVLALEYRVSHQSLRYMFRVLDLQRSGRIGRFEIRYFLRGIAARMSAAGHESVDTNNVCDEIFDMVSPAGGDFITLEDLKRCRAGHTVVQILCDVAGFWSYDNREVLYAQGGGEHDVLVDLPPTDA